MRWLFVNFGDANMMNLKMHSSVGCIYNSIIPYFDKASGRTKLKARPCLILSEPKDDHECMIVPVSTMLQPKYRDELYDIYIDVSKYPKLHFHQNCYIRCSKQTLTYEQSIDYRQCLGNLKVDYPEIYMDVIERVYKANKMRLRAA